MQAVKQALWYWTWLLGVVVLLGNGVSVAAAQAANGWTSSATYAFGQVMSFSLNGDSDTAVRRVSLLFQAPEFDNTFVAEVATPDDQAITATHHVDLSRVRLAPFTTVTYWWVLEMADGRSETVPEQTIVYEDDQFEWHSLTQDGVAVHWTGNTGDDTSLGQLALDVVAETWPQWAALVAPAGDWPVKLYIYPASADLRAALRLTGRDWVGAHAHPELGVILVTAVNSRTAPTDLRQSIPHEMTHYLLYQTFGAVAYDNLPIWLNEGLATLMEASPNPNYTAVLATAVNKNQTLPLADLCARFPIPEEQAILAYAESASFVRFIQQRYGNQTLQTMLAAYADGVDCSTGVQRATGLSLVDLEKVWLSDQQPRSPLTNFLWQNGLWLLLLAGGFVVTGLIVWQNK